MQITLEITNGTEVGRKLWLAEGQAIVVGRTQLAEFAIPGDTQLSGAHFRLSWKNGGFQLRDLNSTNGTTVNGTRVEEMVLCDGDIVVAGSSTFCVRLDHVSGGSTTIAGEQTVARLRESMVVPSASTTRGTIVFGTPVLVDSTQTAVDLVPDEEPAELLSVENGSPFEVVCLPWQNADGVGRLTVLIKATFAFTVSGVSVAEPQLPIWFADQLDESNPLQPVQFESDTAPFKPRADIVLVGQAHAPGGRPRTSIDVRLRVGGLQNKLRVFGNRRWLFPTRIAVVPHMTDPEPFVTMPLSYSRAFGGIDKAAARYCAENLIGVGFIGEPTPTSIHDKPLPNIENPERLIGAWDSRPGPVGFGFYGRGWQPRLKFAGTYDEAYRRTRSPRAPDDFAYDFFNAAHPSLQVAGYLDGDELVELENLTRDGLARFTLPGRRLKITLTRYVPSATESGTPRIVLKTERSVRPFLDTLVLMPDERRFYLLYRAVFAVRDLDQLDVARIRVE